MKPDGIVSAAIRLAAAVYTHAARSRHVSRVLIIFTSSFFTGSFLSFPFSVCFCFSPPRCRRIIYGILARFRLFELLPARAPESPDKINSPGEGKKGESSPRDGPVPRGVAIKRRIGGRRGRADIKQSGETFRGRLYPRIDNFQRRPLCTLAVCVSGAFSRCLPPLSSSHSALFIGQRLSAGPFLRRHLRREREMR